MEFCSGRSYSHHVGIQHQWASCWQFARCAGHTRCLQWTQCSTAGKLYSSVFIPGANDPALRRILTLYLCHTHLFRAAMATTLAKCVHMSCTSSAYIGNALVVVRVHELAPICMPAASSLLRWRINTHEKFTSQHQVQMASALHFLCK